MSSSFLKRISLVSNSGLVIAEHPSTRDESQQQLQGGLITAIMSFAREVHKTELESLSLHDRLVTFVPMEDYFLITEFSNSIDRSLVERILNLMREQAIKLLADYPHGTIPIELGQKFLEKITAQEWIDRAINKLGLPRPLTQGTIFTYSESAEDEIGETIARVLEKIEKPDGLISFMLPIYESNCCVFVLVDENLRGHYLKMDDSAILDLFRLTPILNSEVEQLSLNEDMNSEVILEKIRNTPDLGFQFSSEQLQDISITFLEKNIRRRLDHAITAAITGRPIVVTGDKVSTRIVVNSLQLFTQHVYTEVVEWLDSSSEYIGYGTTGLDRSLYDKIKDNNDIVSKSVVINLDKKRAEGGEGNKYVHSLFKTIKGEDVVQTKTLLKQELQDLTTSALKITAFTSMDLEDAREAITNEKRSMNNDERFEVVLTLAKERNPVLEEIIQEFSEALKSAESFLGEF